MMEIEQLWKEIDARVACLPVRTVSLANSLHRVTGAAVMSPCEVPSFDQSSMDGYAFAGTPPGICRIQGSLSAGTPLSQSVTSGTALRILTGGMIPEGTVAVARQEDCSVEGDLVTLRPGLSISPGENIRRRGGIVRTGDLLIPAGTKMTAGGIALLASVGREHLPVIGNASVLHLVTGDEILGPGVPLPPGKTYDSNGPMIRALLCDLGGEVAQDRLADDPDVLLRKVLASSADVLLISGGSGPGDRDHTRGVLESAGFSIHVSRLNSRPGKPLIFATKGSRIAFGLPGNPLSQWVCFHAFVKRALCRLQGLPVPGMRSVQQISAVKESTDPRRTWTPGILECRDGQEMVRPLPWKHSGDLTPIIRAEVLILDADKSGRANVMIL
ncbi:MAG: molybdopterin molybdotransferase MoeA [Chthoniobacterales bacterium]|nr:molybdopterin molybdotransferase MoeA [Chthoniobacterales bacterium]